MSIQFSKFGVLAALPAMVVFGGCSHLAPGGLFSTFTHTPPGTAVDVALARKPELVRMPLSPATASSRVSQTAVPAAPGGARVPAVEPELPKNDNLDRVADAYSRGNFCMQAGNDAEAISAFEEAVKYDPSFTEAWQNLAALYEKNGQDKKAIEAYKRAKKLVKN